VIQHFNTTAATDLQSTVKIYMAIGQSRPVFVVDIFVAAQLLGQIATKIYRIGYLPGGSVGVH